MIPPILIPSTALSLNLIADTTSTHTEEVHHTVFGMSRGMVMSLL
jgi:hypothetical protein